MFMMWSVMVNWFGCLPLSVSHVHTTNMHILRLELSWAMDWKKLKNISIPCIPWLPALIHMFETWPSKVNLSSISMPNTFIASEDGRETLSTVTFSSASLMLLLLTSMVWNLAGFAAREFFLNHSINETISLASNLGSKLFWTALG